MKLRPRRPAHATPKRDNVDRRSRRSKVGRCGRRRRNFTTVNLKSCGKCLRMPKDDRWPASPPAAPLRQPGEAGKKGRKNRSRHSCAERHSASWALPPAHENHTFHAPGEWRPRSSSPHTKSPTAPWLTRGPLSQSLGPRGHSEHQLVGVLNHSLQGLQELCTAGNKSSAQRGAARRASASGRWMNWQAGQLPPHSRSPMPAAASNCPAQLSHACPLCAKHSLQ